ncbi:S9 family peptidase [Thalassotalea euphylliae]|uniref:S9 family peptidase n=1 Tax=Thalassotalea euphylliae TaxID=1655234 RepID=A0A3E0U5D8_9GAMM|nr:S9 family peptidase [Thalassotalea euphylliae]REL31395.1 S9 family peptidase [Thalassotalea euphylliae]
MATAPDTKKQPHKLVMHGHERVDNYYWLRDDSKQSPEVIAHLNAENAHCQQVLAHTEALQECLFQEMVARQVKERQSVPFKYGAYFYWHEYIGDAEYPIYWRDASAQKQRDLQILNANVRAKGHAYYDLAPIEVSEDGTYAAIAEDTNGDRLYQVSVKHIKDDNFLNDKLVDTSGELVWCNTGRSFYYVKMHQQTLLPYQVYRHRLGTTQDEDELLYEETDQRFWTQIAKSKDKASIVIYHGTKESSGVSLLSADDESASVVTLLPKEENHLCWLELVGDRAFILTNWQAKNFKVVTTSISTIADKSTWHEVVGHREDALLENFEVFNRHLVFSQRVKGLPQFIVKSLESGQELQLEFNDSAFSAYLQDNLDLAAKRVRINYTSMTTPESVLEFELSSGEPTLLQQHQVAGEFNAQDYCCEHIEVGARDGQQVPVTLVYRKDKFSLSENPILIDGYGAYGFNVDADFSYSRLSLLDRGVVYAFCHVRGSAMLGRHWYEQGKMLNKQNTFNDFVDATQAIVALGYGAADKVLATGGSAGGLLIGATLNQAPELYLACAVHVPFVDVLSTMLDESLPLTCGEYDEWGNPNDKTYYDYILSYSPYDQIKRQAYPHLLVTSGLYDSQVQYFEPAKWVAKLREYKTDSNSLLFKCDMEVGHGGQSGRFNRYREVALEYAFYLDVLARAC